MKSLINTISYPLCCEVVKEAEFYIKDVLNSRCILTASNDYHLSVINRKEKEIFFLKIDKCVFNDADDKKCDLALLDDKLLHFVEIKEIEKFDSHIKRNKVRKEAKIQLINTIKLFKELHNEIDLKNVYATIALQPKFENNYIKIITSKEQNVIDMFMESCGCPNIFEGNRIEFK